MLVCFGVFEIELLLRWGLDGDRPRDVERGRELSGRLRRASAIEPPRGDRTLSREGRSADTTVERLPPDAAEDSRVNASSGLDSFEATGVSVPGVVAGVEAATSLDRELLGCSIEVELLVAVKAVDEEFSLAVFSSSLALPFPLPLPESGWMANAFNVATGKSATPIIVDVSVSRTAEAPPLIGSVGPISTSYSRGRYLDASVLVPIFTIEEPYNFRSAKLITDFSASTYAAKALSLI